MAGLEIMVQYIFQYKDVKVITPTLHDKRTQSTRCKDSALKIVHFERIIGCAKTFKMLKTTLYSETKCMGGRIMYVCSLC